MAQSAGRREPFMRTLKRLLLLAIVLALAACACAHWFVRTDVGAARVAKCIERKTGYKADISSAGLTWGMKLVVSDLRLWSNADGGTTNLLLVAPEAGVAGCGPCHERHVRLVRPVFTAFKSELGSWTPTRAYEVAKGGRFDQVAARLADKLEFGFELVDASVVFKDGNGDVVQTFSGLDWTRSSAKVKGHPGVMLDVVSLKFIDNSAVEFNGEWLVENGKPFGLGDTGEMLVLRGLEADAPAAVGEPANATASVEETSEKVAVEDVVEVAPAAVEETAEGVAEEDVEEVSKKAEPVEEEAKAEEEPPLVQEAR